MKLNTLSPIKISHMIKYLKPQYFWFRSDGKLMPAEPARRVVIRIIFCPQGFRLCYTASSFTLKNELNLWRNPKYFYKIRCYLVWTTALWTNYFELLVVWYIVYGPRVVFQTISFCEHLTFFPHLKYIFLLCYYKK